MIFNDNKKHATLTEFIDSITSEFNLTTINVTEELSEFQNNNYTIVGKYRQSYYVNISDKTLTLEASICNSSILRFWEYMDVELKAKYQSIYDIKISQMNIKKVA